VRVGVAHASAALARVIVQALGGLPGWQVAWTASSAREAVACCRRDLPEVFVCQSPLTDLPADQVVAQVLSQGRCAILLVASGGADGSGAVFDALGAGALDVVPEPWVGPDGTLRGVDDLIARVRMVGRLSGAAHAGRSARSVPRDAAHGPRRTGAAASSGDEALAASYAGRTPLVVLGASTGGPQALSVVLAALRPPFAGSVVIVQHLDEQFTGNLLDVWARHAELPVRPVLAGELPPAGVIVITGSADDLVMRAGGRLGYDPPAPGLFYHPSVDVFFKSVARHWPRPGVAAVLTGIGRDGAEGLLALRRAGWRTIAQDQATSAVYGMPKAARDLSAAEQVLPLDQIGPAVVAHVAAIAR
jgi:two-component system response regulator WspF